MPIPAFDLIRNILPPHLGDPTNPGHHSPYRCTPEDVCVQLGHSGARAAILEGLLQLRQALFATGFNGFQWLGGSFVENIETQELRDPGDVDVVTFISHPVARLDVDALIVTAPWLLDHDFVKATFHVDHYLFPLSVPAEPIVELTRYWYGLFSHRRDREWKGMLRIELTDPNDDAAAFAALGGTP